MRIARLSAMTFFVCWSAVARAEPSIQLAFVHGRVWLAAANAPVAGILREWARRGNVRIVNGDAVPGGPVTLTLTGVPEREALRIILREAAGYVLAARADGVSGASMFDRILILPATARRPMQAAARPQPEPEDGDDPNLSEPLAALVRAGLTRAAKDQPADRAAADRPATLPDALADLARLGAAAAAAPAPSPALPESSPTPKCQLPAAAAVTSSITRRAAVAEALPLGVGAGSRTSQPLVSLTPVVTRGVTQVAARPCDGMCRGLTAP